MRIFATLLLTLIPGIGQGAIAILYALPSDIPEGTEEGVRLAIVDAIREFCIEGAVLATNLSKSDLTELRLDGPLEKGTTLNEFGRFPSDQYRKVRSPGSLHESGHVQQVLVASVQRKWGRFRILILINEHPHFVRACEYLVGRTKKNGVVNYEIVKRDCEKAY